MLCVAYAFNIPVTARRVVGACREFVYTQEFVDGCHSCAQNWSPLSDRRVDGHSQRGMQRFTKILAVPSVVNSAAVTVNISARRLKQAVKWRM